jgi:hypothetical protein
MKSKFTLRAFTGIGLSTVGWVEGDWRDLAVEALRVQSEDSKFHLAECCESYIENQLSDNDEVVTWEDVLDSATDDVLHCNAPFIYKGNKQITSYPKQVYQTLMAIGEAQCKSYFDKEEYVHPTFTKKTKKASSSEKVKAKYPGVYASPTKSDSTRFVAFYRQDGQTKKLGFYSSEEKAIEAKKEFLNPNKK